MCTIGGKIRRKQKKELLKAFLITNRELK